MQPKARCGIINCVNIWCMSMNSHISLLSRELRLHSSEEWKSKKKKKTQPVLSLLVVFPVFKGPLVRAVPSTTISIRTVRGPLNPSLAKDPRCRPHPTKTKNITWLRQVVNGLHSSILLHTQLLMYRSRITEYRSAASRRCPAAWTVFRTP